MGKRGPAPKRTRSQLCAEPGCPNRTGERDPRTAFLILHCDEHRYNHSDEVRDGQPSSSKWERITCSCCKTLFERYYRQNESVTGKRFCSMECRDKVGVKPKTGFYKTCEAADCDEQFYVPVNRAETAKFCSGPCRDRNSRTRVYLKFTCKACGDPFEVAESQARWNTNEFCSRTCYRTYSKYKPGDKKIGPDGYVMVYAPDHCMAQPSNGWAFEHRMVISDLLGRPLKPSEEVHHRSGVRTVNTPDQLVLMSKSHPAGAGIRDTLDWCRKFIEENEGTAEALEAAGVHTTLDTDDAVVPLLGEEEAA